MSTNARIYLDFNATAPLASIARDAVVEALDRLGNPSSVHAEGRAARDLVERARDQVAALARRPREQVVFTSGGTEANALGVLALAGTVERSGGPRVVAAAAIDHPSLRGAIHALVARGWSERPLAVDNDGRVSAAGITADVGLVVGAAVNHELGTRLAPEVLATARAVGARIHLDAVQAAGKLDLGTLDADTLAISAHKLGGTPGAGALLAPPLLDDTLPLVEGGHQERGRRAGTENVLGIVAFGAAAGAVEVATWREVAARGEQFEAALRVLPAVRIHGRGAPRIGGTINAGFAGARGESIVIALDLAGVAVSTGAACTSGTVEPSPVLLALGLDATRAREAVRFSLGRATTLVELDAVLGRLPAILERARRIC